MSGSTLRPSRVAVLADTDSRWKWGMLTAHRLSPQRIDPYLHATPAAPSPRQLQAAGVEPDDVAPVSLATLVPALVAAPPDVLVLALPGGACQAALQAIAASWPVRLRRPVVVSGYVGVVYEKLAEGLLLRAGSDVILANSRHDARTFCDLLAGVGVDPRAVVETSLPFLGPEPAPVRRPPDHPYTVTFAAQPGVPGGRRQRAWLVERLVSHARRNPARRVVFKLRGAPGERLTHPEPHPYHALLARIRDLPPNVEVTWVDMSEALARTDLLVTVSSTAALEAMHREVPTMVLTDFGIRESLGNAHFIGSGCLAGLDDLDAGAAPVAHPGWTRHHGVGRWEREEFPGRIGELLASPLPALEPWYGPGTAPAYLPGLLASYGLAVDGSPLRPESSSRVARLARRAVRRTARTMYDSGARVVAPALRRWSVL